MNGYSAKLIEIDDQMVALGRPVPPVVSWISRQLKGDIRKHHADWQQEVLAWEQANPEAAAQWYELRDQYRTQEESEERAKYNDDDWRYEQLRRSGCPDVHVGIIRGQMKETNAWKCARDWLKDGMTWSLILSGGPGCGKTTAAAWAAHQLAMRNYRPKWVRCAALVDAPMWGGEAELLKFKCKNAAVLILDDIGSGAREKDAKAWLGWLDDVLDYRWSQKRKTIITTNIPVSGAQPSLPSPLANWLGARLCDRLNEGIVHEIAEPSMRRKSP